ncbi:MAG: type VI secretion system protein TssR domain-containing protein, partial [Bacteroidales bacterium]
MNKLISISLILLCCLSACAPINFFTKAKRRPALYSENFLGDTIKMPRSEANKKAWIVYSLWDKNPTFLKRGGKVTLKEMSLMEPMIVVGSKSKGQYLKLVKYKPEILKNEKLTNRKKAEYYGWVDKSQMLLFNTSATDVRTGLKDMAFTAISDTVVLFYPKSFIENDSVKIFSDLRLSNLTKKTGLYQFVYKYQSSADGKKWLIGREPTITPDNAIDVMLGWVDKRMVEDAGQRVWYAPSGRDTSLPEVLKIAPVINPMFPDSGITFRTIDAHMAIDRSDNVIYEVDGNAISYYKRLDIERELKHLNIYFTIESSVSLDLQLPLMINAIQNMIPFFADRNEYNYTFTIVAGDKLHTTQNSITDIVNWMIEHKDQIWQQTQANSKAWVSLGFALDLAMRNPTSSNLFVNIGETINSGEKAGDAIIKKLAKNNGRLLAFQLYAKDNDSYNNYVLQATDMIEGYAAIQAEKKRGLWVFTDQIRSRNSL